MNATNDSGLAARSAFSPLSGSRWTKERETVREICVTRSRAGFLAARLLKLRDDCADASADLAALASDAEETRLLLRQVIQRYARLLIDVGESARAVLRLVDELPLEATYSRVQPSNALIDDMRRDLIRWASQEMAAD